MDQLILEVILQAKLHVTRADFGSGNVPKVGSAERRRGIAKHWRIRHIHCFHAEFKTLAFKRRPCLQQRAIERLDARAAFGTREKLPGYAHGE